MVSLSCITSFQSDIKKLIIGCRQVEQIGLSERCDEEEMVVDGEEKLKQSATTEEIDMWLETECKERAPDRAWTSAANLWFNPPTQTPNLHPGGTHWISKNRRFPGIKG